MPSLACIEKLENRTLLSRAPYALFDAQSNLTFDPKDWAFGWYANPTVAFNRKKLVPSPSWDSGAQSKSGGVHSFSGHVAMETIQASAGSALIELSGSLGQSMTIPVGGGIYYGTNIGGSSFVPYLHGQAGSRFKVFVSSRATLSGSAPTGVQSGRPKLISPFQDAPLKRDATFTGYLAEPSITYKGETYFRAVVSGVAFQSGLEGGLIYSDGAQTTKKYGLAGTYKTTYTFSELKGELTLTPESVKFSTLPFGKSRVRRFTVENTGAAGSLLTGTLKLELDGANPSKAEVFSTSLPSISLEAGDSVSVAVYVNNTVVIAPGTYTAKITARTDAFSRPVQSTSLRVKIESPMIINFRSRPLTGEADKRVLDYTGNHPSSLYIASNWESSTGKLVDLAGAKLRERLTLVGSVGTDPKQFVAPAPFLVDNKAVGTLKMGTGSNRDVVDLVSVGPQTGQLIDRHGRESWAPPFVYGKYVVQQQLQWQPQWLNGTKEWLLLEKHTIEKWIAYSTAAKGRPAGWYFHVRWDGGAEKTEFIYGLIS